MWGIYSIHKLYDNRRPELLAPGFFTLYRKKEKVKVTGWLPTHHSNVDFHLELSEPNDKKVCKILNILQIKNNPKKKIQAYLRYAGKLTKNKDKYIKMAEDARNSMALWTLAVLYTYYNLPLDINGRFLSLVEDFTKICRRGFAEALPALIYNYDKSVEIINRGLLQMGELPKAQSWTHLKQLHEWQKATKWSPASWKEPKGLYGVQKYNGKWIDSIDIDKYKELTSSITPDNTTVIIGTPNNSETPLKDAKIVVRNEEDAYKWKMNNTHTTVYILKNWPLDPKKRELRQKKLGVWPLKELEKDQDDVVVAYAHLWGQEDWLKLLRTNPKKFTLIGRLDQYPCGRGQIFRDVCESKKFQTILTRHHGAEVIKTATEDDLKSIKQRHGTVQCFYNGKEKLKFDLGRIQLKDPRRIRTIRAQQKSSYLLYEEESTSGTFKNLSVISARHFQGVKPHAGVYICSEEDSPFDLHVARTQCKDVLYIIGEPISMFSLIRRPPSRNTIGW